MPTRSTGCTRCWASARGEAARADVIWPRALVASAWASSARDAFWLYCVLDEELIEEDIANMTGMHLGSCCMTCMW